MATQVTAYISEQNPSPQPLTALQLIDRSRQGLLGTEAGRIAGLLGVTDKEMARLLNQSTATFHRHLRKAAATGSIGWLWSNRFPRPRQV
jgi:hypothetical protein